MYLLASYHGNKHDSRYISYNLQAGFTRANAISYTLIIISCNLVRTILLVLVRSVISEWFRVNSRPNLFSNLVNSVTCQVMNTLQMSSHTPKLQIYQHINSKEHKAIPNNNNNNNIMVIVQD